MVQSREQGDGRCRSTEWHVSIVTLLRDALCHCDCRLWCNNMALRWLGQRTILFTCYAGEEHVWLVMRAADGVFVMERCSDASME